MNPTENPAQPLTLEGFNVDAFLNEWLSVPDLNPNLNQEESATNSTANDPNNPFANILNASLSTIALRRSHLNTLYKYGFSRPDQMTMADLKSFIRKIREDKHVKDSYLATIITTLKLINPNITSAAKLNLKRKSKPHMITVEESQAIEELISESFSFLRNGTFTDTRIENDTKLAVVLTFLTNLRVNELKQLTLQDLERIKNKERILIKTKRNFDPISIVKFGNLFDSIYPFILRYISYRNSQISSDKLITIAPSGLNLTIKRFFMSKLNKNASYGLKIIRVYTTTKLIDSGNIGLAQALNRHSNVNVTLDNYNRPVTSNIQI